MGRNGSRPIVVGSRGDEGAPSPRRRLVETETEGKKVRTRRRSGARQSRARLRSQEIRNPDVHPGVAGRRPGGEDRERPRDWSSRRPVFSGTSVEREKGFETEAKAGFIVGSATYSEPSRRERASRDDEQRARSHLRAIHAEPPVTALDLPRAVALASAVEAFVRAGLLDHARPLAAELAGLLRAAEGACADVAVLGTRRERR